MRKATVGMHKLISCCQTGPCTVVPLPEIAMRLLLADPYGAWGSGSDLHFLDRFSLIWIVHVFVREAEHISAGRVEVEPDPLAMFSAVQCLHKPERLSNLGEALSPLSAHCGTRNADLEPTLLVAVHSDEYGVGIHGFKAAVQAGFGEGRGEVVIQELDAGSCHRAERLDCHSEFLNQKPCRLRLPERALSISSERASWPCKPAAA